MSEICTELKLRLPEDRARGMAAILSKANGSLGKSDVFQHYGKLGEGVEALMRASADDDPDWLDEQLTPEEALSPYGFGKRGNLVKIEYLTGDDSKEIGENLAAFLSDVFETAGIEVVDTFVYSEHELEDMEDEDDYEGEEEDEEDEFDFEAS